MKAFGFKKRGAQPPPEQGNGYKNRVELTDTLPDPLQQAPSSTVIVELPHPTQHRILLSPAPAESPAELPGVSEVETPGRDVAPPQSIEHTINHANVSPPQSIEHAVNHARGRRRALDPQRIRQRLRNTNNPGRVGTDGEHVPPLVLPLLERRTTMGTRRRGAIQPSFNDRYEGGAEFRPDGYGRRLSSGSVIVSPAAGGHIPRPNSAYHPSAIQTRDRES